MKKDTKNSIKRESFDQFCHDLKNPLTSMKLNLELVELKQDKKVDLKMKKFVKTMNKEIDRMIKMIQDVGKIK